MSLYGTPEELESLSSPCPWFLGGQEVPLGQLVKPLNVVGEYLNSGVLVLSFEPDFNFLENQTLSNLMGMVMPPVSDSELRTGFGRTIKFVTRKGKRWHSPNIYANPVTLIRAGQCSKTFLAEVHRSQGLWKRQLRDSLQTTSPTVIGKDKASAGIHKQLVVDGVLIVNRKHQFPGKWPQLTGGRSLVGCRFGRLRVLVVKPRQTWQCQCDCGKVVNVKSYHLNSGRTRSCGCLREEVQAGAKLGKQNRRGETTECSRRT